MNADFWRKQKMGKFARVDEDSFTAKASRNDGLVWNLAKLYGDRLSGGPANNADFMDLPCGWRTLL
jgi:hypothetical protein